MVDIFSSLSELMHSFRVGDNVPFAKKGRFGVVHGSVKEHFGTFHVQLETGNKDELKEEELVKVVGFNKVVAIITLRMGQDSRHFGRWHFQMQFVNENVLISRKISLNFVPKSPIDNKSLLVQVMACHRTGDKPLSDPIMVKLLMHICVTRPQWVKQMLFANVFSWMKIVVF